MLRSIILGVALASGGSAAMLVNSASPVDETALAPAPVVDILAAIGPIAAGKEIKIENLGWVSWPEEALTPAYHIRTNAEDELQQFAGMIAQYSFAPGQPVLTSGLSENRAGFLSVLLTPGMRAVAIEVSAAQTAGGFILPDNRVDVLLTSKCAGSLNCKQSMKTETILQNIRVLAIDQSGAEAGSESQSVIIGKTATLELKPEDAEDLIAAEASGSLSLLLRSADDTEIVQLSRAEPELLPMAPSPAPLLPEPKPAPRTVKITRAGVSEVVVLQ